MSTCARNLPQHFNGCACKADPGITAEVSTVDLYPDGTPRAYSLLAKPEQTVLPDGTTVINHMAAPADTDEGIFGYGGSANPSPMSWVDDDLPGIPGKAFSFSGSVGAKDGAVLMSVRGTARSHQEAWDRLGPPKSEWADKYDQRPYTLEQRGIVNEAGDRHDAAVKERLAVADELDAAISERKNLRGPAIFARRRKVVEANARIDAAWAAYQEAYPYAKPQKKV